MNARAIADAALKIGDLVKRQAYIQKACLGNDTLLQEVQRLLKLAEQSQNGDFANTFEFSTDAKGEDWAKAVTKAIDRDGDEEIVELGFLQPSASPDAIGMLGHYEIRQILGRGGFGVVFKAFDETLHRFVAIKVMNAEMAATSPPRKRFLREARSAARTNHTNIVQVHAVHEEPLPFLVMEFVDGSTLQQKLDGSGPLEASEILHLGSQIAAGLAAAHELGLIHRDIKPGNILIEKGAQQKVKITDFGLARSVDDSSMTQTGMISGTPMYMAPEQAMGASLDHRTDLFSLGSVLYQMASGRPPFRAPTTIAVLRRVAEDTPRPLQEIISETPDWLVAIIDRLMEKKPEDRFQSAGEVADLMGRYQSELQLHGKVTSFHRKEIRQKASPAERGGNANNNTNNKAVPVDRKTYRPPKAIAAVVAGVLSLTAILGWFVLPVAIQSWSDVKTLPADSKNLVQETNTESSESWLALFDGSDVSHWQTIGPFKIQDGLLIAHGGGANAISKQEYSDFELEAEWKIGPLGNGGIYYREEATSTVGPGNEYQLLDDAAYSEKQPPVMQTGSLYGMLAPIKAASRPIGEWNKTRILCQGTHVEHWLNDEKLLTYDTASSEWKSLLESSPFPSKSKVATKPKGHILLQGHTGEIAFRSIRIREIATSSDRSNVAMLPVPPKIPIKVLPPIHGETSLVPRPQAIQGLKSWGLVRSYPSGPFTGVGRLRDGKSVTTSVGSPCIFIHNDDWSAQQVLLPQPVGDDLNSSGIIAFQIAPRSNRIAFVNSSLVLCVYDLATEQIVWQKQLSWRSGPYKICFNRREDWLAIAGNSKLQIFFLKPGATDLSLDLPATEGTFPRSLTCSPDDQELWMIGHDSSFYAYSAKDLKEIKNHPFASFKPVALDLTEDLSEVALVSANGDVKVIRVSDRSETGAWKLEKVGVVTSCHWSPNQQRIVFSDGNRIEAWDRTTQTKIVDSDGRGKPFWNADSSQITTLFNHVDSLTFDVAAGKSLPISFGPIKQKYMFGSISPDGTQGIGGVDGQAIHFQTSTGRPDWRLRTPSGEAAISNRNDRIIIQSSWAPEASKVFRMSDLSELFILPGKDATWSPDDATIAMVQRPNSVVLYDSKDGKERQRFEIEKGERVKTSWSPDGRHLAVRVAWEKPALHLWDTKTEKLTTHRQFPETPSEVNNRYLSPAWRSNRSVLVPFADQVFEAANSPDALPTLMIKGRNNTIAIAHDGQTDRFVFSQQGVIGVHEGNGKELVRFHAATYGALQWLPDGRRFVSSLYYYYELPFRGFDANKREQLGCSFPCLSPEAWLTIGPTGHYQGSNGIESEFRYIALHEDNRLKSYTPAEFAKTFQWKNDPQQATFLDIVETEPFQK